MTVKRVLLALLLWADSAAGQPAEFPVREVDLSNGDRRSATTITIDGRPVEVGIDTVSTGLRVLPRGLGPAGAAAKGPRVTYSYGAGTAFEGQAATVPASLSKTCWPRSRSISIRRTPTRPSTGCALAPVGYCILRSPIGYRYERVAGHGKMLMPDEPAASAIREALERLRLGPLS